MTRTLFLHETIDIVGDGATAYMHHLVHGRMTSASKAASEERGLIGTFSVCGTTGRWPQVINLNQIGDWDAWGAQIERTYVRRGGGSGPFLKGTQLQRWWRQALAMRSGGFDRILGSVPGCPTLADLRERDVRGSLFVHEVSEVRPGAGPEYLAAVDERWRPIMKEYGVELVGLYEVMFHDTEVVTVWATHVPNLVKAYEAGDPQSRPEVRDDRMLEWRSDARRYLARRREELMVPYPGTLVASQREADERAAERPARGRGGAAVARRAGDAPRRPRRGRRQG